MFLESFKCADSDALTMTMRTFIDIFAHFLSDFLRFMLNRLYDLPTLTTIKSDFTAFRVEVVLTFFSEWWDIHEISVSGRHMNRFIQRNDMKMSDNCKLFTFSLKIQNVLLWRKNFLVSIWDTVYDTFVTKSIQKFRGDNTDLIQFPIRVF